MENSKRTKISVIGLFLVSVLWGYGFVAVDIVIDAGMHPTMIMSLRFLIASLFIVVVFIKRIRGITKRELLIGIISGIFLFLGFYMQTVGQKLSTASKSAFISSTSVVMVPFIVWILQKKRPKTKTFVMSLVTLVGVAIISFGDIKSGFNIQYGDTLILFGALFFAIQMSFLGVYGRLDMDAVRVTFIQMLSAGVISIFTFLIANLDTIRDVNFAKATPSMLYIGIISTSICYLIHMASQKYVSPTETSIILSTESLFASFFAILFGHDNLTLSLVIGGIIVFVSVIISGVNFKNIKKMFKD